MPEVRGSRKYGVPLAQQLLDNDALKDLLGKKW
jgi:hypothetical protein